MHYLALLALLGAIATKIGAIHSAREAARALVNPFDLSQLAVEHTVKYTNDDPQLGRSGFEYATARLDEWAPIEAQHVNVSAGNGAATISIDPLNLNPEEKYMLRYNPKDLAGGQVDQSEQFNPPRRDNTHGPSVTSASHVAAFLAETSSVETSPSTAVQTSKVQSSLDTVTTTDLNPTAASATASTTTTNSGASGIFHGLAAFHWALILLAAFQGVQHLI